MGYGLVVMVAVYESWAFRAAASPCCGALRVLLCSHSCVDVCLLLHSCDSRSCEAGAYLEAFLACSGLLRQLQLSIDSRPSSVLFMAWCIRPMCAFSCNIPLACIVDAIFSP